MASSTAFETILDGLGSPAAVVTFGATTLALLGTTVYLQRLSSGAASRSRSKAPESHEAEEVQELDRTKYPGGHLAIYYGSQTGTAQMFAKQIASEAEARGFCARIVDLQDVVENEDPPDLVEDGGADVDENGRLIRATLAHPRYRDPVAEGQESGDRRPPGRSKALFLVATYGEGEPTDNAQEFAEMMKGKAGIINIYNSAIEAAATEDAGDDRDAAPASTARDATFLHDLDYVVFGLGNKQYEHYNNMGRFVDAALGRCGARRAAALGLGDDDDDLEGDFEAWKDGVMWPALAEQFVARGALARRRGDENGAALPPCPYAVEYLDAYDKKTTVVDPSSVQKSAKHYVQAVDCPVVARRELRDPSDPGSTVHMEIDISQHMDTLRYQTADNLGVLPENDAATVEAVAKALGYDLNQTFRLLPNNTTDNGDGAAGNHALPFPTPCTVRECLSRYCDLAGSPRRSDLKQLAPHAGATVDRRALTRMASKEGKAEYKEKIVAAHVGVADLVTRLCPSIACDLAQFIAVCPRLQPRYYTIASSAAVHPETVHLTQAVLETARADGKTFRGVCSGHLADLRVGETARVFVRESAFRLPRQVERPILMFGPGTGIAPMRGFLQERAHARAAGATVGPSILYFGCKKRSLDYLYRDELEAYAREGTLTELHLAFSREQPEKVYVQHLLARRAAETWRLIHKDGAAVFVCGAVRMGADVDDALQVIIAECGGMTRGEAKAYLDKMAAAGRFVQELWA